MAPHRSGSDLPLPSASLGAFAALLRRTFRRERRTSERWRTGERLVGPVRGPSATCDGFGTEGAVKLSFRSHGGNRAHAAREREWWHASAADAAQDAQGTSWAACGVFVAERNAEHVEISLRFRRRWAFLAW
eukprot:scaffold2660_cov257-Pinguiococcus_pyrenoidosus.AAC.11